jgi:predicted metal-dependent enzyme (double-stranded beta helix superfamily)
MAKQHLPALQSRRDLILGAGATTLAAMTPTALAAPSKPARSSAKFDVEQFVEDCKAAGQQSDAQSAVQDVLARQIANPTAVLTGLGEPTSGGIKTLYRSPSLTILNIVWAPLMQLMPHEHRMWALIGIYAGREDNIFWERQDGRITAVGAASISPARAVPLPRDVVHSVVNPIEKLTGAIHIYGGDFFEVHRSEWDPETLVERDWDIESAVRLFNQSNERFFRWKNNPACR